jgi:probable HAF family extracellular repeat protein
MQRPIRSAVLAATMLAAPVLALLGGTPAAGQARSPYVLQTLSDPNSSLNYAAGINASGIVVGAIDPGGALTTIALEAAVFTNGQVGSPGQLDGFTGSYDYAINDAGLSVGWSLELLGVYPGPTLTHATAFANGTAQDLGALPGGGNSTAYAVNQAGLAAGYSTLGSLDTRTHAVLFSTVKPSVTDLGTLPGDVQSIAYGINDYGQVVGSSFDANLTEKAVLYANGTATPLGFLPGDVYSSARAINEEGQAVGYSGTAAGPTHAVLFQNGQVIDLGVYPGGTHSTASAINNFGQVVGSGDVPGGTFDHALLFQNGQVLDLGVLPDGPGSSATGINDRGDIVGTAVDEGYIVCAVKWTLAHFPATVRKPVTLR